MVHHPFHPHNLATPTLTLILVQKLHLTNQITQPPTHTHHLVECHIHQKVQLPTHQMVLEHLTLQVILLPTLQHTHHPPCHTHRGGSSQPTTLQLLPKLEMFALHFAALSALLSSALLSLSLSGLPLPCTALFLSLS